MGYLRWLAFQGTEQVRTNGRWMTWNLLLAFAPLVVSVLLVLRRTEAGRRTVAWWVGAGVFVLLLPNAPYVVTDLVHLRSDVAAAPSDGVVLAGVLPLYAGFVLAGFCSYVACVELVAREAWLLGRVPRAVTTMSVHAVCSIGIVLGRLARLNSWDSLTSPTSTVERSFETLAWRGAPVAVVAVFIAVALTHAVVRTLVVALAGWARRVHRWAGSSRPVLATPGDL